MSDDELIPDEELEDEGDEDKAKLPEGMALEQSEREVEINLPKTNGQKSYTEALSSPNLTDLRATLAQLFPEFPIPIINRVAKIAMVARIGEDVFLDMLDLNVASVMEELEADGMEANVQEVIDLLYYAFSIGLGGRGRADGLELAGSAKEAEELEKVARSVGLAS